MEIIHQYSFAFLGMAVIFGVYMCWGIGANDVANAMGITVASGSLDLKKALIIAAIFEFAGAVIAGDEVTRTIRSGFFTDQAMIPHPEYIIYGMLAVLLSSALGLMVASAYSWPVSTTHHVVGSVVGVTLAGVGWSGVQWDTVLMVAASWLVSPLLGVVFAYFLMISIRRLILDTDDPFRSAQRLGPIYAFLIGFLFTLITSSNGSHQLGFSLTLFQSLAFSLLVGLITALIGRVLIHRIQIDAEADSHFLFASVEKVFNPLMVLTACAMAYAHGSNDVANGVGPLAAIVATGPFGALIAEAPLPLWILVLGGVGIVVGLATYGYRVMETIGHRITELTPSRGFCATLAAAITVILATRLGLPVSTTHITVGAVMGVGIARGISSLDRRVLGGMVISWLATLPAAGVVASIFFYIIKNIFS